MSEIYSYPYGFKSVYKMDELAVELKLFLNPALGPESPGKEYHFWNICELLWPKEQGPGHFYRNPWNERMCNKACTTKYLSVIGSASSGKSDFFAVWAIVNWLCAPLETLVLVTSTSLKDAKQRIWGRIRHYFMQSKVPLPGRLVDSAGIIRTDDGSGSYDDAKSITLIAAEQKKEKEAVGKLIGRKAGRILFIADELPELSESIISAAFSNLAANPHFQLIGIGNFKGMHDPLGILAEPKDGYESVTVDMDEWETKTGTCIRFDGLKSPNVLAGKTRWVGIYDGGMLEEHRRTLLPNSAEFWRMVRSFPCPIGDEHHIYSEPDILAGRGYEAPVWLETPEPVTALDPGFTNGGDRTMIAYGYQGRDLDNNVIIAFTKSERLVVDVRDPVPRNYQIARQFRDKSVKFGAKPFHAGMDATGAGSVLYDIIAEEWSPQVMPVNFGGVASDLPVTSNDPRIAKDHYSNHVSELWYVGVEFLKACQLRGITKSLSREMCARMYNTVKGIRLRVTVEPKSDMKVRVGYSPDEADAFFILLNVCRTRLGAIAGSANKGYKRRVHLAETQAQASQEIYVNSDYAPQDWADVYESAGY